MVADHTTFHCSGAATSRHLNIDVTNEFAFFTCASWIMFSASVSYVTSFVSNIVEITVDVRSHWGSKW